MLQTCLYRLLTKLGRKNEKKKTLKKANLKKNTRLQKIILGTLDISNNQYYEINI